MADVISITNLSQAIENATGQLSKRSRCIYENDAKMFASWLQAQGLTARELTRSHVIDYRSYLDATYARAAAARMLSVARRILDEQVIAKILPANPAKEVKGFTLDNESPHIALSKQEAKDLLAAINTSTPEGKRDYALLSLLLRTGIRRSEYVALNRGMRMVGTKSRKSLSDRLEKQRYSIPHFRTGSQNPLEKVSQYTRKRGMFFSYTPQGTILPCLFQLLVPIIRTPPIFLLGRAKSKASVLGLLYIVTNDNIKGTNECYELILAFVLSS